MIQTRFEFDTATALDKGRRAYQEDAVIADFFAGSDLGLVVLSDGMGGHAAGDVASNIVVAEVHATLTRKEHSLTAGQAPVARDLQAAAMAANAKLRAHVMTHPETRGMGATLVATAIVNGALYWISIGDSALLLFRDGELTQLNEDHSMAPQIDFMADAGLLTPQQAENHPDRNTLTSALCGDDISKIDCPEQPMPLRQNDILLVASDGLQFLATRDLHDTVRNLHEAPSASIARHLMAQVTAVDDPNLDNISLSVIKVTHAPDAVAPPPANPQEALSDLPA